MTRYMIVACVLLIIASLSVVESIVSHDLLTRDADFGQPLFRHRGEQQYDHAESMFEDFIKAQDISSPPELHMKFMDSEMKLHLERADSPISSGWDPVHLHGYVKEWGPIASTVSFIYIPAEKSLSGYIDVNRRNSKQIAEDQSHVIRINFDQVKHGDNDTLKNIAYKPKGGQIPRANYLAPATGVTLQKRAVTKASSTCQVVAVLDAYFLSHYGYKADSYVKSVYQTGASFYRDVIGINMELNRIVHLNQAQSAAINGITINDVLSRAGQGVRGRSINVLTTSGRNPCLVHFLTFRNLQPSLGLAYVSPQPGPVVVTGGTRARSLPVEAKGIGGVCAPLGWNVFVTTFESSGKEIPFESAVQTVLHEMGHTLGATHREQCCQNVASSLGVTTGNLNADGRSLWLSQAAKACASPTTKRDKGLPLRDVMSSNVEIGLTSTTALGVCVRGMIERNVNLNRARWEKTCLIR